jgi:cellulose synthase/poly-beta-1,6-N-acetylglucosamine synthase-like glycosyltransferase
LANRCVTSQLTGKHGEVRENEIPGTLSTRAIPESIAASRIQDLSSKRGTLNGQLPNQQVRLENTMLSSFSSGQLGRRAVKQERYLGNLNEGSVAAEVATNPVGRATVSVIITTFNYARFLADAISSVLAQTRQADEIIVVDDGSTDHPEAIIANFPMVRMIRQDNRGLPAARNTGLRNCATSHIVFLDADDRLLPTALESGLACAAKEPDCAFVYGGHRRISENGQPLEADCYRPLFGDAHLAFLRGNPISTPATVLYRRDCLVGVGGFDETLRRSEDYELYLRIAQSHRICSHEAIVAEYRRHGQNMSANFVSMLQSTLAVLDLHEKRIAVGPAEQAALRDGRSGWRSHYASEMLEATGAAWRKRRGASTAVLGIILAAKWSPSTFIRHLGTFLRGRARNMLPATVLLWIQRLRGRS